MPDNHRLYLEHNPENNRKWAETIGPSMVKFVSYILKNNVGKKRKQKAPTDTQQNNTSNHGFTRGAQYFGGNKK